VALWLERALSLQGWKVAASQPSLGSKEWMDARMVLASLPARPLLTLTFVGELCCQLV